MTSNITPLLVSTMIVPDLKLKNSKIFLQVMTFNNNAVADEKRFILGVCLGIPKERLDKELGLLRLHVYWEGGIPPHIEPEWPMVSIFSSIQAHIRGLIKDSMDECDNIRAMTNVEESQTEGPAPQSVVLNSLILRLSELRSRLEDVTEVGRVILNVGNELSQLKVRLREGMKATGRPGEPGEDDQNLQEMVGVIDELEESASRDASDTRNLKFGAQKLREKVLEIVC
jgi:hypothetical protein